MLRQTIMKEIWIIAQLINLVLQRELWEERQDEKNDAINEELTIIGKKNNINLSTVMYYQDAVFK